MRERKREREKKAEKEVDNREYYSFILNLFNTFAAICNFFVPQSYPIHSFIHTDEI
jgi:hypothetical protein